MSVGAECIRGGMGPCHQAIFFALIPLKNCMPTNLIKEIAPPILFPLCSLFAKLRFFFHKTYLISLQLFLSTKHAQLIYSYFFFFLLFLENRVIVKKETLFARQILCLRLLNFLNDSQFPYFSF